MYLQERSNSYTLVFWFPFGHRNIISWIHSGRHPLCLLIPLGMWKCPFWKQVCNHSLLTTGSCCWKGRSGSKTRAAMVALSRTFPSQRLSLRKSIAQGPPPPQPPAHFLPLRVHPRALGSPWAWVLSVCKWEHQTCPLISSKIPWERTEESTTIGH